MLGPHCWFWVDCERRHTKSDLPSDDVVKIPQRNGFFEPQPELLDIAVMVGCRHHGLSRHGFQCPADRGFRWRHRHPQEP